MIDLYNDDCLSVLPKIKDNSVNLILTDPPYEISKKSNFHTMKAKRFSCYKTDFGEWDHAPVNMQEVVKQCYRILKPGGAFICFYDLWKIESLRAILEQNKFKQIRFIEWLKTNPVPMNSKINYLTNAREIALVGIKGSNPTFNASYHNGIYKYPICHSDRVHPTQKNIDLLKDIIQVHTNEHDVVLDCFMGGGSCGVACSSLNRDFIGIELDRNYFNAAKQRIEKAQKEQDFINSVLY